MSLKEEIEQTIKIYENLFLENKQNDYKYLSKNNLAHGICKIADFKGFVSLEYHFICQSFTYLCDTPAYLKATNQTNFEDVHKIRINYLKSLLNTL